MKDAILVLNAGSSSLKFSLFTCSVLNELRLVYNGHLAGIGTHPHFTVKDASGQQVLNQDLSIVDHESALMVLLDWLAHYAAEFTLIAAGHRVVHGSTLFHAPVLIDTTILEQLTQLIPLAPLHQPHNLAPIRALMKLKQDLPQVACFDTAFHCTQPAVAQMFALPRRLTEQGIKRYGFHGLSYEYIAESLPQLTGKMPEKTVIAHLGNGSSLCALYQGKSVATTMGFTALDGLPMGTRCGAIDPGVLLHLLNQGMSISDLSHLLYYESGLLGVSDISNDMQELLSNNSPQAQEAINLFIYQLHRELGALVTTLAGLDTLVFTAGIGQHAAKIRADLCHAATWLGVELDEKANQENALHISTEKSRVSVWVIPTDEEKMIAKHTYRLIA